MADVSSADSLTGPPLSTALHTATRELHQDLNRQIMARLPLCTPPYTNDPLLYAQGMTVFSQIYFAFESSWQNVLSDSTVDIAPRHHEILSMFPLRSLFRTPRLQADLATLKRRLGGPVALKLLETDSQIFTHRVEESIRSRPHVLLAYAWTMYLALFNGGRWIRKQLREAGDAFWLNEIAEEEKYGNNQVLLSFWDFEGTEDGDDIKQAFKQRFSEASSLLNEQEKEEIVAGAKQLFVMCSEMVQFLDEKVSLMQSQAKASASGPIPPAISQFEGLFRSQPVSVLTYVALFSVFVGFWHYIPTSSAF